MVEAHSNDVLLNGNRFAVKDGIIQVSTQPAWADPLRITGNQQRGDRINASQWVMESWASGWGFRSHRGAPPTDPNIPAHPSISGFFDSTLETRWEGQVTLPGLIENVAYGTAENSADDFHRLFIGPDGNGDIPYLLPSDATAEIAQITYSTEVIDQADDLAAISNYAPIAPINVQGTVIFFGGIVGSAVPANYRQVNQAGTHANFTPSANVSFPIVSGLVFRDIIYVATIDHTNGKVIIESSSDDGDNFAQIAGMTVPAGAARVAELVSYFDAQGQAAVYLQTDTHLYLLDIANSLLEPVLTFSGALGAGTEPSNAAPSTNGLPAHPVVWNGNLYLPRRTSLIEWHFTGQNQEISPLVLGRVPDENTNTINNAIGALYATEGWLYVGFSGGAGASSNRCSIWAFDGQGFHYIWEKTSANTVKLHDFVVTNSVDVGNIGKDTLYVLYEESGATDNMDVDKIENVTLNPLSLGDGNKKYAATGVLVTPWHDGGMSEVDSMILGMGASTDDLDTTSNDNEKVTIKIDTDRSGTFGNALTWYSDSASVFQKYASGAGLSGKVWAHEITLDRGSTNTKTPVLYYPITYYQKVFSDIHSYQMEIDVKGTTQINQGQGDMASTQGVLRALEAIHDSIPLVAFSYPATTLHSSATRYVRMISLPSIHKGSGNPSASTQEVDQASVLIQLEEVV